MNNRTVLKLPSWLPGARFKRYAQEWYPLVIGAIKAPFDKVKSEVVSVTYTIDYSPSRTYADLGSRNCNSFCRRKCHIKTRREFNRGRPMGCQVCPRNNVYGWC